MRVEPKSHSAGVEMQQPAAEEPDFANEAPASVAYRVVHVEDDSTDHLLVRRLLSKSDHYAFDLVHIDTFAEAIERLKIEKFDFGLIDYKLAGGSGLDLIDRVGGRNCKTPFVVLTGLGDLGIEEAATNAGAYDFLDKSELTKTALERSFRNVRAQFEIEQKLRRSEAALREAKLEAEEANRAKSDFLARVSHDLRTPLNAILGFSEVVKKEVLVTKKKSKWTEYAADIHYSGQLLLSMIDDILELAKIDSGTVELREDEFSIDHAIQLALRIVNPTAASEELQINTSIDDDLPRLRADRQMVDRIFFNLLSNAMKFNHKGGEILVSASLVDGELHITVENDGKPIPAGELSEVTRPYYQVESSTPPSRGVGLGLPIVRSMIELHDGSLNIEGAKSARTRVTVIFPKHRLIAA